MREMFATAKPDLQPDVTTAKQRLKIERRTVGIFVPPNSAGAEFGQYFVKVAHLIGLQGFTFEAAIKVPPWRT